MTVDTSLPRTTSLWVVSSKTGPEHTTEYVVRVDHGMRPAQIPREDVPTRFSDDDSFKGGGVWIRLPSDLLDCLLDLDGQRETSEGNDLTAISAIELLLREVRVRSTQTSLTGGTMGEEQPFPGKKPQEAEEPPETGVDTSGTSIAPTGDEAAGDTPREGGGDGSNVGNVGTPDDSSATGAGPSGGGG